MAETPEKLTLTAVGASYLTLSWTQTHASAVKIYRDNVLVSTIDSVADLMTYTDNDLQNGTEYVYTIVSVNSQGDESAYPAQIVCTTSETAALGTNIQLFVKQQSEAHILLSWDAVENATAYQLIRSNADGSGSTVVYSGIGTEFDDTSVVENTAYTYFLRAYGGSSIYTESNTVDAQAARKRTENFAYLPLEWFSTSSEIPESRVDTYLDQLEAASINMLYCDIGKWEWDYTQNELSSAFDYSFLNVWLGKAHARGMKVIPCVNCSYTDKLSGLETQIIHQLKELAHALIDSGLTYNGQQHFADGIHVDFEPYGDPAAKEFFIDSISALRTYLGSQVFISSAVPTKNGNFTEAEMLEVINVLDMINPMIYDTNEPYYDHTITSEEEIALGISRNKQEYIRVVKETCIWYNELIEDSLNPDCILAPTVPVYENKGNPNSLYGFPDPDSNYYMYHCVYNYLLEEPLETLDNAMTGILEAKAGGAEISSLGIFYWKFISGNGNEYSPSQSYYYNHEKDMDDWLRNWVENPVA